ncbi:MAG: dTMP kinase [Patescibacteria group bacterium]
MFIVIEGIDGAGCETQGKNLIKMCKERFKSFPTTLIKYPDYERNVGKLIKDFLYQNKNLNAEQQFLLYSLQFLMDKEMIAEKRKSGILIADRYFTTTLCYQTLEGIRLEKALSFAEDFGIEKPDLVFYVKVDPDIAIKRKSGEQKEKNFREKDFDFIRKTHKQYQMLVDQQVWTKWVEIDGNKGIEEITKDIYNELSLL